MNHKIHDIDKKKIEHIQKFIESLGINIKNLETYIIAFVHRSLINERPDLSREHNERLEFLGDAVLELAITKNLYDEFPQKPEGELTDIRSAIVKGKSLAEVSKKLGVADLLFMSKGEDLGGGRQNDYILANACEAIIGAIYIEEGYTEAKKFIDKYIYPIKDEVIAMQSYKDKKSLLQEYTQREYSITPVYEIIHEEGLDHNKTFVCELILADKRIISGTGSSKKKAQEQTAINAYDNIENWKHLMN